MSAHPPHRHDKREILRGLYEENRRVFDGVAPEAPPGAPARRRGGVDRWAPLAAVLGLVVLAGLGALLYRGTASRNARAGVQAPAQTTQLQPPLALTPERSGLDGPQGLAAVPLGQGGEAALYGLAVRTIVIDAGHGGRDPGAIGRAGLREKDITLDVARRLRARLEAYPGVRVLMTRERDAYLTLRERVEFANEQGADLFVSIHVNALPIDTLDVVETYYFGRNVGRAAQRLAEAENRESGYTLSEFKEMVQNLGSAVKLQESRRLARSIQNSLYRNIRAIDDDVASWGVKRAPFLVLLGVDTPSVLAEIAAISHPGAEARLGSDAYREQIAGFLESGIASYLDVRPLAHAPTEGASPHGEQED